MTDPRSSGEPPACHSGDRHAARSQLIKLGLARVVGDTIEPIRRSA